MKEVHCKFCQCPIGIWKPSLKTYKGDECRLYDGFTNVIYELEKSAKPFANADIIDRCRLRFRKVYNDIQDFEATINEMIVINLDLGIMPNNYRPLHIIQK